jgi:hypothetical protein
MDDKYLNTSLFGSIFDGPDSVFGRVFGEFDPQPAATPAEPDIRIKLKQKHIDSLLEGKELKYKVGGRVIRLVASAKYEREYVDNLLRDGYISKTEADIMLRMRA